MFKPAVLWGDLSVLDDLFIDEFSIGLEDGEFGRGGRLIDGGDVLGGESTG